MNDILSIINAADPWRSAQCKDQYCLFQNVSLRFYLMALCNRLSIMVIIYASKNETIRSTIYDMGNINTPPEPFHNDTIMKAHQ